MLKIDKEYLKTGVGLEITEQEINDAIGFIELGSTVAIEEFDFDGKDLFRHENKMIVKQNSQLVAYIDLNEEKLYLIG